MVRQWCASRALSLLWLGLSPAVQAAPVEAALARPAVMSVAAAKAVLQGAARVGDGARVVAVGERGIVVLSDDAGRSWRQVPTPTSVGLTAVQFVDAQHGWIVGHGGVVLASQDGGQTWRRQFDGLQAAQALLKSAQAAGDARGEAEAQRLVAEGADKPLLDLHFFDAQHGWVVGAYNLAFETRDGGQHWTPVSQRLDNPKALHLYSLRARGDEIVIVGEQGLVLRSTDRGQHFQRLAVPYKGSFFTAALPGQTDIVVAGLRGNVWRSGDGGASWQGVTNPVPASITTAALDARGQLWLGNQAGLLLRLQDTPQGPAMLPAPAKLPPLTGLLPLPGDQALALSLAGAMPVMLGTSK